MVVLIVNANTSVKYRSGIYEERKKWIILNFGIRELITGLLWISRCCHLQIKSVTHDGSATQNCTPFSRSFEYIFRNLTPYMHSFKYICRYFHPYFTQKQVQFCQKKNPFFGISSTPLLTHPFFGQIKNREKLIYLDKIWLFSCYCLEVKYKDKKHCTNLVEIMQGNPIITISDNETRRTANAVGLGHWKSKLSTLSHIFRVHAQKIFSPEPFSQISSTRSWEICTPYFPHFEYTPRKSTPFFFSISRTIYVRKHSIKMGWKDPYFHEIWNHHAYTFVNESDNTGPWLHL